MTTSDNPKISVIIPIHNRSEDLRRSVPSVLAQTERSFELLIIDDASTEDLSVVINQFDDSRIKLVRNSKKGNAASVRNTGIELSTGQFIAFLDSDDEWFPEHLSSRISYLDEHSADGVYGSVFVFDGTTDTFVLSKNKREKQHPADYLLSGGSIPTPTWVMRSEAAKKILFDPSLVVHEDYDFFIRFSEKFKWSAMWQPTTRVYWQRGVTRLRHPKSEIEFTQKYFGNIAPRSYFNYCLSQLGYYKKNNGAREIIEYYIDECLRYMEHISFTDYCSIRPGGNFITKLLRFVWLIFIGKIRKKSSPKL